MQPFIQSKQLARSRCASSTSRSHFALLIATSISVSAASGAQAESTNPHRDTNQDSKCISVDSSNGSTATGQNVSNSNDGGVFMEEVVDPKQQVREVDALRKPVKLNRRALTPEELSNVGVQAEPSGRIIPLLNPNATSPIAPYGTQMSTYTEFPGVIPLGPGVVPYGFPAPYRPGNRIPGPYGAPGLAIPNGPYTVPYGAPYAIPYPRPGVNIGVGTPLNVSGSSTSTVAPAPNGGVTFGTSGTINTGPTLQGGMNISPGGAITGGARLGLPTVTEYESRTTITPILPQLPPPTAPDSN